VQSSSQIITNKPTSSFLQAGCPFCHPTNSVKALKEKCVDNNNKYKSTRRLNVTKSQLNRTFLKVLQNRTFVFEMFTTQTTAKLFVV